MRPHTGPVDGRIGVPQPPFAISRSLNFWILPVEVLGIGSKRTSRGTL